MWAEERLSAWNCGSDVLLVRSFVRSYVRCPLAAARSPFSGYAKVGGEGGVYEP